MKDKFSNEELISIKKALYFYNSYFTNEYKKNGRELPKDYDEKSTISAEMRIRVLLGEDKEMLKLLYGDSEFN
jgi:hypothetical protein